MLCTVGACRCRTASRSWSVRDATFCTLSPGWPHTGCLCPAWWHHLLENGTQPVLRGLQERAGWHGAAGTTGFSDVCWEISGSQITSTTFLTPAPKTNSHFTWTDFSRISHSHSSCRQIKTSIKPRITEGFSLKGDYRRAQGTDLETLLKLLLLPQPLAGFPPKQGISSVLPWFSRSKDAPSCPLVLVTV